MTPQNTSVVEFPIASTRLRTLIRKKHLSTLYTQITKENKTDPILTKMILFNMFQIFRINKLNFEQYLILHHHPDTFIQKSDAITQTDYTTIRPNPYLRTRSNRMRTPLGKKDLEQYWLSDDNDSTDDELQKESPPKQFLNKILHIKPIHTSHFKSRLLQLNIRCLDWTGLDSSLMLSRNPQHHPSEQFAMTTPRRHNQFFQDDLFNYPETTS